MGKGTLLRKLWPSPCREEPILGHPDGVEAALPGAYKYVSSGYWSAPFGFPPVCGMVGGHQNQLTAEGLGLGRLGQGAQEGGEWEKPNLGR